jgi:outer membrane protein OmpA-like peptidoglycan-associated protein
VRRPGSLLLTLSLTFALLLGGLAAPSLATAQGSLLSYKLKPAVEKGKGYPQVFLECNADFRKVELICDRDGTEVKMSAGAAKDGKTLTFDLKQPEGESRYKCEARGWYGAAEDEYFDLYMNFDAFLGGTLSIEIPRDQIEKESQFLVAKADRVVTKANVKVIGPDGPSWEGDVDVGENEAGDELLIDWQGTSEVLRLDVTVFDRWGFYAYEELYPWSLEIPHDDVHFDTGSHEIKASEQPKVDKAWTDVADVVARYGKFVEVRLFIAGYTDTVGDRSSNQGLSERRARSIAQAFKAKGFTGKVYYQGFGEDALKIHTDDSVDELLNRRALYVLASRQPPAGPSFPRGSWKAL